MLNVSFCFIGSDVDECKSSVCPSSMSCINTFGSFTCDCGSGQQYDAIKKKCIGNHLKRTVVILRYRTVSK